MDWNDPTDVALAVLGIGTPAIGLIRHVFFRKQAHRLCYKWSGQTVVANLDDHLKKETTISFAGQVVDRVNRTRVVVWNAGTSPIQNESVVPHDPLHLAMDKSSKVLRVDRVKPSRASTLFTAEKSSHADNQVEISFHFLEPGDSAVFDILHTGTRFEPLSSGTILQHQNGLENRGESSNVVNRAPTTRKNWSYYRDKIFCYRTLIILLACTSVPFSFYQLSKSPSTGPIGQRIDGLLIYGNLGVILLALWELLGLFRDLTREPVEE